MWPARFLALTFVNAFEMLRNTVGVLSRVTDVAASQIKVNAQAGEFERRPHFGLRDASARPRRSVRRRARPQRPRAGLTTGSRRLQDRSARAIAFVNCAF
jgi:hypothetical protein